MYYLEVHGATKYLVFKKFIKRIIDFFLSLALLIILLIPILFLIIISTFITNSFGLFTQKRVGKDGKTFFIYKIKTIDNLGATSNFGAFLRKSKLDELPQLFNIVVGEMSFVGPRPDIEEFANKLSKEDEIILSFRPGLTGPATIKFLNEEKELRQSLNPNKLINEYWNEKVKINKDYVLNYYLYKDIYYMFKTLFYVFKNLVVKASFNK